MTLSGLSAEARDRLSRVLRSGEPVLTPERTAEALSVSRLQAAQQLARWAKAGWLARVRRGVYVPVPIESASAEVPLEDAWSVAAQLYAPCYIGGWSAAEHWGLTEQIFRAICVMTTARPRQRKPTLRGTQLQLHTVGEDKLFGLKSVWRGQTRVQVSDPARTLADMLADPQLGGGIRNVADMLAVLLRENAAQAPKLIEYLDRLGNGAAFKRLGFMLEAQHPAQTALIDACRGRLTSGYVKLDPKLAGRSPDYRLEALGAGAGFEGRAEVISREEVRDAAREFQLDVNVVEKDYVLGWLLAGIAAHPELRETWIFKGGTCLKKCWFETYRFSEDLDFTVRDEAHLDQAFLANTFEAIGEWVYEQCGIELPRDARAFEVFSNPRGKKAAQGRIGYRGPNARLAGVPRIKLDLAADELLVLDPIWRPVHHPYSDAPPEGIRVLSCAYEEVFAEKLRALAERQRPRDLYDVVHLHRRLDLGPNVGLVHSTLARKCEFKGIGMPTLALLPDRPERQAIEVEWEQMLAHQLPVCPPFAEFWNELVQVFDWLQSQRPPAPLPSIGAAIRAPAGGLDTGWRAPPMVERWGYASPLEAIRFAGANHLLVDLDYEAERGERSKRIIEPYALRRTQSGEVLLYAVRNEDGETRSYRVDHIRGAKVLQRSFGPRFAIELTSGVPVTARQPASRSTRPGPATPAPARRPFARPSGRKTPRK